MIIKKDVIKRTIGPDTVLIPVGKTILDSNGLYVLNELGAFIWDLLPDADNAEELCEAVLAEYEVSKEEASRDITDFLDKLRKLQIV